MIFQNNADRNNSAMGITGLQTFMKKNSIAFEQVNLADIAELYRNETKKDPVMLVDISSCVQSMIKTNNKIRFMLGELQQFRKNIELFINKCFDIGIHIEVILDGMLTVLKKKVWQEKTERKVLALEKIFLEELCSDFPSVAHNLGFFLGIALEAFQSTDKCKVRRALYEADSDIIAFAKKYQCFAIFSNDSDFIIVDGVHYILSAEHFNLESMTTYNYNRNKLVDHLRIDPYLLPFYASLCYHTHLDSNILEHFYHVNKIKNKERFMQLAKFVRKFSSEEKVLENLLKRKTINGISKKMLEERIEYFSGCVLEKDITPTGFTKWDEILKMAKKNFQDGHAHKRILEVLLHKEYFFKPIHNVLKPSSVAALRFFREKIYGILFFECPDSRVYVTEHSFETFTEGTLSKYVACNVSFIRRFHVGLLTLWSDTSKEAEKQKRKVFCEAINENLKPEYLISKDVPEELLFPLLAVFLMRVEIEKKFSWTEAKTILIQAIIVRRSTCEDIKLYPEEIDKEAVELSCWFIDTLNHLYLLNSVCGDAFSTTRTSVLNYFDGKVLHDVWAKLKETKCLKKTFGVEVHRQYRALASLFFKWQFKCGYDNHKKNLIPKKLPENELEKSVAPF